MRKEKNEGFFTKNSLYNLTDEEKTQLAVIETIDISEKTKNFFKKLFLVLGILLSVFFTYSKNKSEEERLQRKIELEIQIEEVKRAVKSTEKAMLDNKGIK